MNETLKDNQLSEKPSKWKVFLRRSLSTVLLWGIVLSPGFLHPHPLGDYIFLLLMILLSTLGLMEFYRMAERKGLHSYRGMAISFGIILLTSTFFYLTEHWGRSAAPSRASDFECGILVLFVLGLCLRQLFSRIPNSGLNSIAITLFGLMYIPWLLNFIQKIYFFTGISGFFCVFYFIIVTKFSDMGAYLTGSLIGKHKVIPRISPGKTWEGLAGAVIFSVGISILCFYLIGNHLQGMTLINSLILGAILSISAVIGDLIESLFKRESGLKDSGGVFPGIGGILDLLDSILFNAPLMYLYLRHIIH